MRILIAGLVVFLVACQPQRGEERTSAADTPAPAAAPAQTSASAVASGQPDPTEGTAIESTAPDGQAPRLLLAGGPAGYLTDASGAAVYFMEGNYDGTKCDETCERAWPPVVASNGKAQAGAGIDGALVSSAPRAKGGQHVTYGGYAVYRYAGDQGPGRTSGDGVKDKWGQWHVVRPDTKRK